MGMAPIAALIAAFLFVFCSPGATFVPGIPKPADQHHVIQDLKDLAEAIERRGQIIHCHRHGLSCGATMFLELAE